MTGETCGLDKITNPRIIFVRVPAYGSSGQTDARTYRLARWQSTAATVLFEDPPESVSGKGDGARITVLTSMRDAPVAVQVDRSDAGT